MYWRQWRSEAELGFRSVPALEEETERTGRERGQREGRGARGDLIHLFWVEREHAGGGRHRPGSLQPERRETTVMDLQKPPWNFYFPGIQLLLLILFLFSYLNMQ